MQRPMKISGEECVHALVLAGFRIVRFAPGHTFLQHGSKLTIVPDSLFLSEGALHAILDDVGLSHATFINLLDDEPTLQDVTAQLEPTG